MLFGGAGHAEDVLEAEEEDYNEMAKFAMSHATSPTLRPKHQDDVQP